MQEKVYVGVGSNLNDPVSQVITAISQLAQLPHTNLVCRSSLYRSLPMGPQDQPNYVNAVVLLVTDLEPLGLLDELQALEERHGRKRTGERWGPRTLDLDILMYGENIINSDRLVVPHPGLHERPFVLYPLHEIAPEIAVPEKGKIVSLLTRCPEQGLEKILE